MSLDIVEDIKQIKIESLNLNSAQLGADINTRFKNIDENFQQILNSEYLKGAKGDSVFIEKMQLSSNPKALGYDLYVEFKKLILTSNDGTPISVNNEDDRFKLLDGQEVSLVHEIVNNNKTLISLLPFIFKDELFNINSRDEDLSCIICYQDKKFVKIQDFPTLYYNAELQKMCWKINGVKTELVASGIEGPTGKPGVGVYITKYVIDTNDRKKITEIFYRDPTSEKATWIEVGKLSKNDNPLVDNCVIFSINSADINNNLWETGLLTISLDNEYIFTSDEVLNNIIGTKGANILDLMKDNKYIYIPGINRGGDIDITNNIKGHALTCYNPDNDLDNYSQEEILYIGPGQFDSTGVNFEFIPDYGTLESRYENNVFKKINIGNNIELNSEVADFSNVNLIGNSSGAKTLVDAEHGGLKNVGASNKPTYFLNGIPVACGNSLAVDITGESASAKKLGNLNIGATNLPVYFSNGVPVACGDITVTNASKLVSPPENIGLSIGNVNKPTYFSNGVPVACGNSLTVDITGNSEASKKLVSSNGSNLSVGNANKPIYFSNGVPMQCNSHVPHIAIVCLTRLHPLHTALVAN